MAAQAPSRIAQLAATITKSVARLDEIMSINRLQEPSFDEDAPSVVFPKEALEARDAILDAAAEVSDLLLDPPALLRKNGAHNNNVCLQAIARFDMAGMVPSGGQMSFADMAAQTRLPEQMVRRLLRHAMTMRVFRETEPGMVAHTRASKALAAPEMRDWLRVGTEEMWPSAVETINAMMKWPESSEPTETGFSLANGTTESLYDVLGRDPERAQRFANAMKMFATKPEHDAAYTTDHYDWASLGQARVVDVGGARGHIAMELAKRFDKLQVVVQDMDKVIQGAEAGVPPQLRGRVTFQGHDLFAPQTASADVFFLRWILHNWSDKHCILILRAQIPALKPGARIVIQDTCMPEPGSVALWRERELRSYDIDMAAVFNGRERSVAEWKALLAEADPRFVLKTVTEPEGSAMAIFEVIFDGNYILSDGI
ncbi:hypothetical protein G6O67_007694 [Ophiocordyceps sinensis]|uniref:Sterigmatocystin 8-O-methyltransferase n=2 Tax=Ophiocordyceps sinensis TaxID=72228 RepID=A0A8H4PM10_9HYPO|nr:sterigmatocystin 8-O-methyltransferase [Ophiocordyceps sinensis CO18]KAF4505781.1 hypothetical protein G6O67_007694 [Ophiocordyceps sinensis]